MKSMLSPCSSQSHHIQTTDQAVHSLSSLDIVYPTCAGQGASSVNKIPDAFPTQDIQKAFVDYFTTEVSEDKAKIRPLQTEFLPSHHLCFEAVKKNVTA